MAAGFGGMLAGLIGGDPGAILARKLGQTDLNPAPGASQMAAGGISAPSAPMTLPGAVGGPGASGGLPSPQAYAPDPVNAQNVAALTQDNVGSLLYQAQRREDAAAGINQGIGQIAASFGTAQQQHDKRAALAGMPGGRDMGSLFGDILKIRGEQTAQDEHNRFMASASGMAHILGVSPEDAITMANGGILQPAIKQRLGELGPTDQQKNVDAYGRVYAQGMGYDPTNLTDQQKQDVNSAKANAFVGAMGLQDPLTKSWANAVRVWDTANPNQPRPAYLSDPVNYDAHVKSTVNAQVTQEHSAAQEKANAAETFPSLDLTYQTAESNLQWLNDHKDAAIAAIKMGALAGGRVGQVGGAVGAIDPLTLEARSRIDWLNDQNFRQGFANVKNIRSQMEANRVGGSVSNLDKPTNSAEQITNELGRLQNTLQTSRANLMGAAGKPIPQNYSDKVDSIYTDPKSPYYNGSTIIKDTPPTEAGPGTPSPLDQARAAIAKGAPRDKVIERLQKMGVDPAGL